MVFQMSKTQALKRLHTEAARRERVLRATRAAAAAVGNDFLQSLVKHISNALGADCVFVGEVVHGAVTRMVTMALCLDGEWGEGFEQELSGVACTLVVADGNFVCSENAAELFPMDLELQRLAAQAFVGYRLSGSDGKALGVLCAVFRGPLKDMELAKSVLEAFTSRAAAELERKCDHDRLRRADERHRAFIASSMDAMWRIEFEKAIPVSLDEEEQIRRIYRDGYVAECNEAFARLVANTPAEELVGARFAVVVPPDNAQLLEELRSAVRSGYRASLVETTTIDSLGRRTYRLRSQFGIVENGELQRIWGVTRDITELKRAELALDASERRCREMLERLQLPAVVVDPAGQVLFANEALLELGRWSKQELAAKNWFDVFADEESRDHWRAALHYAGSGPTFTHQESRILTGDALPRSVSWDTTLLLNTDGGVEGIAAIGSDITRQKVVEAQIRQAQRLEGIGLLAAGMAHDFNNLLAVIIGHASQLISEIGKSHEMYAGLSAISAAAIQCAGLTEQLLVVGRQQRLQPVIVNLNVIISDAEAVIRGILGKIELKLQLDSALRPIHADPARMERVLVNLAANARDATPNGGKLVIATANAELDEPPDPGAVNFKPGSYVRLTVTDTGVGMSEDVQTHIFDPFFTTKPAGHGTGMGLSTVYGIVRQSCGWISVQSQPGVGSSFQILLPAVKPGERPHPDSK